MIPASWPALRGWRVPPGGITTRRAVYGKVHRAPTDYRWIAWSSGFGTSPAPLERELVLGGEESVETMCCWRCTPETGAVAVKFYPSRAFDAAGRPAGIEKQVIAATPDSSMPLAALAFLLLPEVARLDDSIWWDTWRDPRWSSLSYHLPLADDQSPAPSFEGFESHVDLGLRELLDSVADNHLQQFYAQVVSRSGPAVLPIRGKELSALALAALLLPLERDLVQGISLAGGFPGKSIELRRLAQWSGIVCPPGVEVADPIQPATQFAAEGVRLADMLKGGLRQTSVAVELSPGGKFLLAFLESAERWFVPGELGAKSLSQVGPWPVVRSETESSMLRERVASFIADLERLPAHSPERRHLATKADLLRALLLVLCPGVETLRAVSLPATRAIPALLFACRVEIQDWPEMARYSASEFESLCTQSMDCFLVTMVREIRNWLLECAQGEHGIPIQQYAVRALRAVEIVHPWDQHSTREWNPQSNS
jgi:hypothetical protein